MQRQIQQDFQRGILRPTSRLDEVKHIGPYLYSRMKRSFAPNLQNLSIRSFSVRLRNMTVDEIKRKLKRALQNRRNNQCAQTGPQPHHVPDVNEMGYAAVISLIKVMANNRDGHGLGARFQFNAAQLRIPPKRSTDGKVNPCLSRRQCGRRWRNGFCHPSQNSVGFEGIAPHTGQKKSARNNPNQVRRGTYVGGFGTTQWRRPGAMRKLQM